MKKLTALLLIAALTFTCAFSVQEEKMFPVVMGIAIKKAYVNILFRFIVSSIRS